MENQNANNDLNKYERLWGIVVVGSMIVSIIAGTIAGSYNYYTRAACRAFGEEYVSTSDAVIFVVVFACAFGMCTVFYKMTKYRWERYWWKDEARRLNDILLNRPQSVQIDRKDTHYNGIGAKPDQYGMVPVDDPTADKSWKTVETLTEDDRVIGYRQGQNRQAAEQLARMRGEQMRLSVQINEIERKYGLR